MNGARSWLVGAGFITLALALYTLASWSMTRFPLVRPDNAFVISMVLFVVGTAAAGWLLKWRRELLDSHGLLRSLTDPFIVALLAALFVGNSLYRILNGALDGGSTTRRTYVIEGRKCFWVRRGGPMLVLRSVSTAHDGRVRLLVTQDVCDRAADGQEVILDVKPGFFGSAWVRDYALQP